MRYDRYGVLPCSFAFDCHIKLFFHRFATHMCCISVFLQIYLLTCQKVMRKYIDGIIVITTEKSLKVGGIPEIREGQLNFKE